MTDIVVAKGSELELSASQPTEMVQAQSALIELGLCPPDAGRVDPMIIGQIIDPSNSDSRDRKRVSFLVAWHLDTAVL